VEPHGYFFVVQVIRNDEMLSPGVIAAQRQLLPPLIYSRADGAAKIRARWAEHKANVP